MNSVTNTAFVAIIALGLFLSPSTLSVNAQDIMSPRQQMASGVAADDVVCKSGLVLMIRATNGAATCVKSSTSMKLSDADWGSIIIDDEEDETIRNETIGNETIGNETIGHETTENATNEKIIELSEGLSMGEEQGLPEETMEEESFTIGGVDLFMAAPVEGDEDA